MLTKYDIEQLMLAGQAKLAAWEEEFQRLYYGRPAEPAAVQRQPEPSARPAVAPPGNKGHRPRSPG